MLNRLVSRAWIENRKLSLSRDTLALFLGLFYFAAVVSFMVMRAVVEGKSGTGTRQVIRTPDSFFLLSSFSTVFGTDKARFPRNQRPGTTFGTELEKYYESISSVCLVLFGNTVEPLYNGHLGAEIIGRCREVAVVGGFN